jgi:heavy metal sensor kinase
VRSIRLSLVVYFLALLGLALGVASWLVYRSAQDTLADKQTATLQLVETRYQARRQAAQESLDNLLLQQALALAGRVQIEVDWSSTGYRPLHVLGFLTAPGVPHGPLTTLPWLCQMPQRFSPRNPAPPSPSTLVAWEIWKLGLTSVKLNDSELLLPSGVFEDGLYYQIDSNEPLAKPLRSESLADRAFPSPEAFAEDRAFYWEPDTIELWPGEEVRRVRVKASSARRRFVRSPRFGGGNPSTFIGPPAPSGSANGGSGNPNPSGPPRAEPPRPRDPLYLTLQVATPTDALNARLEELLIEREEELDTVRAETEMALARLRTRLFSIAGITFVATISGTLMLVWMGLLPLHRLSEAVSKVTPRDFSLPVDDTKLPTELRPIADKLVGTLAALKQAFAREKQALGDISHELRTPLAAILMTTELALRKPRKEEEYREMLGDCRTSAEQMNQIIERMLTLARLDAGAAQLRTQPVDVGNLASQCAAVVRPLAEAAGLTLTVDSPRRSREAELATDPDKLREVINNLLHNAVQYNRPHGKIHLSVARENGHVRVEVEDTGIGIESEQVEHIFERFYRADPSRHNDGLNAGLGLAIVREYVELLSGTIRVESQPGQGTRFRVELPVRSQ